MARRKSPSLTLERILDTAISLLERDGADALTMRRLAAELQVDPMAVYYYVANKDALIGAVIDRASRSIPLPSLASLPWEERIRALARTYRTLAETYPRIFLLSLDYDQTLPDSLVFLDQMLAALEDAGLDPGARIQVLDILTGYLTGFAIAASKGNRALFSSSEEMAAELAAIPQDRLPAIHRLLSQTRIDDYQPDFEMGLSILIAGIQPLRGTAVSDEDRGGNPSSTINH